MILYLHRAAVGVLVSGGLLTGGAAPAWVIPAPDRPAFRVLAELDAGKNPHQIAFSADGRTAFIAASGSNWVARVDVASLEVRDYHRVADAPLGVAALSGGRIAVSRFGSDRVTRYRYGSQTPDGHLVTGGAPSLLTPVPGGGYLVSSERANSLWLLDLESLSRLQRHETGARPFPPAVTSDGRLAFVPNYDEATVSVVDLKQRRTLKTVAVGRNPSGGTLLPGGHAYAVALRGENRVALIDTERFEVVRQWEQGIGGSPFSVVLAPSGRFAFVNNTGSHDVSVVALPEERVVARIPVGEVPIVMAVHPSTETLWVSSEGSHTVTVIATPRLTEAPVDSVPVEAGAHRPSPGSRESEQIMRELCRQEVADLHRFFQDWFTGALPAEAEAFQRVQDALAADFEIISPSGSRSQRSELLKTLRAAHGDYREPPLRIWVENFQGRALADGLFLATYEEWQQAGDGPKRGRLSTALFRRAPQAPGGVQWIHVHEVWIP